MRPEHGNSPVVLLVSLQTSLKDRAHFDGLGATGVHVASKEEDAGNTRRDLAGEDQSSACAVAPPDHCRLFQVQGRGRPSICCDILPQV